MLTAIGALLAAHMIADYPLQTDWMAENKHESSLALLAHSAIHGVVALAILWFSTGSHFVTLVSAPFFTTHAVIDWQNYHIRWDQTAHFVTCIALGAGAYAIGGF